VDVKYGNVLRGPSGVTRIVHPGINRIRLRMTVQVEDLNDAVPNGLPLKDLTHLYALPVRGFRSVHLSNNLAKFSDASRLTHGNLRLTSGNRKL